MRTITVEGYTVGLQAKYGEYNCFSKTCGRLELVVTKPDSKTNLQGNAIKDSLAKTTTRDKIITNFLADLDDSSTFGSLASGAPFFPGDTGHYRPGILVYIDRIAMNQSFTWWNNWKALIEVFETEPKFGVVVVKSPIVKSRYYGESAPSRVWNMFLPTVSNTLCTDKGHVPAAMKSALKDVAASYSTPLLKEELKKLGIAA